MYVLQDKPQGYVSESKPPTAAPELPIATLKDGCGGVAHIDRDDGCIVLLVEHDGVARWATHWFPEALRVLHAFIVTGAIRIGEGVSLGEVAHLARMHASETGSFDRLRQLVREARVVWNTKLAWKAKFDLIFNINKRIHDDVGIRIDWGDPDTTYEADVTAYYNALMEEYGSLLGEEEATDGD